VPLVVVISETRAVPWPLHVLVQSAPVYPEIHVLQLVAGLKLAGHVQVPEPVRKDGAFIDSFVITGNVSSEENVSVYGCSFIVIVSVDGTVSGTE